ncbi:MAG: HAD family hydrolase [Clostridiales bacterium]|nr:HAD family hydrolase [Clostridiales bacterium]MDU3243107.1 HAD family hydrolase [Clostridiales bacterium]
MKKYRAIFFDWDGTAVLSRKAPVDEVVVPMKELLARGVKLAVISGTTLENIAEGRLHEYFSTEERKSLFFGLGRGAYNYAFDDSGNPYLLSHRIPSKSGLIRIHDICYDIHRSLLEYYSIATDIVFSRPNYCKIDLMVENNRGESLFLQDGEKEQLLANLSSHGFTGGIRGLIDLAEEMGRKHGTTVCATTDAKYLEVGISSKSDNVNDFMDYFGNQYQIREEECSFWGDEYIGFDECLFGSDSYMITDKTRHGEFFDVSDTEGLRPNEVKQVGGGVQSFLRFLGEQNNQ